MNNQTDYSTKIIQLLFDFTATAVLVVYHGGIKLAVVAWRAFQKIGVKLYYLAFRNIVITLALSYSIWLLPGMWSKCVLSGLVLLILFFIISNHSSDDEPDVEPDIEINDIDQNWLKSIIVSVKSGNIPSFATIYTYIIAVIWQIIGLMNLISPKLFGFFGNPIFENLRYFEYWLLNNLFIKPLNYFLTLTV